MREMGDVGRAGAFAIESSFLSADCWGSIDGAILSDAATPICARACATAAS